MSASIPVYDPLLPRTQYPDVATRSLKAWSPFVVNLGGTVLTVLFTMALIVLATTVNGGDDLGTPVLVAVLVAGFSVPVALGLYSGKVEKRLERRIIERASANTYQVPSDLAWVLGAVENQDKRMERALKRRRNAGLRARRARVLGELSAITHRASAGEPHYGLERARELEQEIGEIWIQSFRRRS